MKILLTLPIILSSALMAAELDTIEVGSHFHTSSLVDFIPSATTLDGEELRKRRAISLGDTLRNEAGVNSSTFGPNASRPIIRGLEGDRIRVLQNGLGVLDASSQSLDHAVPVDTLTTDSIEIVRGPMSLLYGSSAVGGVVNVTTNRIHSRFEEGVLSEVLVQGETAFDSASAGAKLDYGYNKWMFHIDGSYRNSNNQEIPGKAYSDKLISAENIPADEVPEDELPNSHSVQKTGAIGISKIFDKGYAGVSYYHFDNLYGAVAEEEVNIKMQQNRYEAHGEYRLGWDVLKKMRLRSAQSDYEHREIEEGETATLFVNEGNESRLEFFTEQGSVKGVSGIQTQYFNFSATGEEAYLPTSQNVILSAFTLQEMMKGKNTYSVGARFENGHIESKESDGAERNFNGYNGSLGLKRGWTDTFSTSLSLSYTERFPNFQELFASGNHIATGAFERGNEDLNKEQAYAVDLGFNFNNKKTTAALNFYTQHFNDYIALFDTGVTDPDPDGEGFNFFDYTQVDAIFYGMDFDASHSLTNDGWNLIGRADWVRGKNKDSGDNLPRISPPRITLGIEKEFKRWAWDIEGQYNFAQTKVAPNETRTDSFFWLNSGVNYDLNLNEQRINVFARLRNILNQEARAHTSIIKEIAPLPGRNLIAGLQYLF